MLRFGIQIDLEMLILEMYKYRLIIHSLRSNDKSKISLKNTIVLESRVLTTKSQTTPLGDKKYCLANHMLC